MSAENQSQQAVEAMAGVALAVAAFLIWGFSPIYFKTLRAIPAFEILMHRMVWSFVFLLPLVFLLRRRNEFWGVLKTPRSLLILVATTLLVGSNWFVFIWAINNDQILQTSLGYYINPLMNVLMAMVFLKEKLRPPQFVAVFLAAVGVVYLTIEIGTLPWIALYLAISFGLYGLIRKVAPVNPLVGLTIETMLLSLPALAYLIHLHNQGAGAFLNVGMRTDILLMCAALVTAVPLLLFTSGAKKIHFSTLGILQYIAPSGTFIVAVFIYDEPFRTAQVWTFGFIWTALVIYSADSFVYYRKMMTGGKAKMDT